MTKELAKNRARELFPDESSQLLACILVNDIYKGLEENLDKECENIQHEFTVSTKELCNILEYFKKNMVQ